MVKSILSSRDVFCLPVKPAGVGGGGVVHSIKRPSATLADRGSITKHLADEDDTRVCFLSLNFLGPHYVLPCLLWMVVLCVPLGVPSRLERNAEIHPSLGALSCLVSPFPKCSHCQHILSFQGLLTPSPSKVGTPTFPSHFFG